MDKLIYIIILLYPYLVLPLGATGNITYGRMHWLSVLTAVLWLGFLNMWSKKQYRPKLMPAHWSFLIFAGLATVSTLFSHDLALAWLGRYTRYEGLWAWYSYMTLFLFAFWFISSRQYRKIINAFMLGGLVSSIYGIVQHFGLDFLPRADFAIGCTYSFYDNPSFFGAYLVLVVMIGSVLFLLAENNKTSLVWLSVTLLAFIALVYSRTMGAWVGLGAALAVFAVFTGRNISWKRFTALIMTFICIFGLIALEGHLSIVPTVGEEAQRLVGGEDGLANGRGYVWKRSLPLVMDYFWLGSGPDTFGTVFPQETELYWDKAHCEVLQIAITMGIPALLAYLAGMGLVFLKGFSTARRMPDVKKQVMLYGLLAACVGYQVHALVNISTIGVAPFFWVILGIIYRLGVDWGSDQPQ